MKIRFAFFISFICLFLFSISLLNFNQLDLYSEVSKKETQNCNSLDYDLSENLHPSNFKEFNLEIKFESERRWRRTLLDNLVQSEKNKKESGQWRKFSSKSGRHKADLIVDLTSEKKCKLKALVREHGDLIDHKDGSLLPSLNINITNGHLFGVTKFILFVPGTRNSENEIFGSLLFSKLGFISPKTAYVNLKYNKNTKKFIFQEKIEKELIESNYFREAPIFEGDERFAFSDRRHEQELSKARIINDNWSKRNKANLLISQSGLSIINHLTQLHETKNDRNDNHDFYYVSKLIFKENIFKDLEIFDSLALSLGSDHTMPKNERRLYFDPFLNKFYPIYYDGNFNIFDDEENPYIKREYIKVIPSVFEGAKRAIDRINQLKISQFKRELSQNGLNLSQEKIQSLIKKIKINLTEISNFKDDKIFQIVADEQKKSFVKQGKFYDLNTKRRLIYDTQEENQFLSCSIYDTGCKNLKLNQKDISTLIAQRLKDDKKNDLIYLGKKKRNDQTGWFYQNQIKEEKILKIDFNSKLVITGKPEISLNKENKEILFVRKNLNDTIVLMGGSLRAWSIRLLDESSGYAAARNNINNLTGCINFIDITIEDLTIYSENAKCEDAVNFIRSKGKVRKLEILNSKSDGMDADFSNIEFNKIKISNSENDCLDFSYGSYKILTAFIDNCGDKAVSAGELSELNINNINISSSNTGIASKDFAKVQIDKAIIDKIKYCSQAYNKKQEFSGGFINFNNLICKNFLKDFYLDKSSKITYKKPIKLQNSLDKKKFKKKFKNNLLEDFQTYNLDNSINAIIEISAGEIEKWEISKIDGSLTWDFYKGSPRVVSYKPYPINYGIVPRTLYRNKIGGDDDPLDIIVLGPPIAKGKVVNAKAIGLMLMTDLGEKDDKIIAVPTNGDFDKIESLEELKKFFPDELNLVKDWFENYKGKDVVEFIGFENEEEANKLISLTSRDFKRYGVKTR